MAQKKKPNVYMFQNIQNSIQNFKKKIEYLHTSNIEEETTTKSNTHRTTISTIKQCNNEIHIRYD